MKFLSKLHSEIQYERKKSKVLCLTHYLNMRNMTYNLNLIEVIWKRYLNVTY